MDAQCVERRPGQHADGRQGAVNSIRALLICNTLAEKPAYRIATPSNAHPGVGSRGPGGVPDRALHGRITRWGSPIVSDDVAIPASQMHDRGSDDERESRQRSHRSELPPDRHRKEPLRRAASAEHPEVVSRNQQAGLHASISDTDTRTQTGSQRIGSRTSTGEPTHAWAKAEEPRSAGYALRRLDRRGQDKSSCGPVECGATRGRRGWTGRKDGAGGLGHALD